jgi:hypothetical protein
MSMPGFFAEASLYSRRARYQAHATLAGSRQAAEIIPSRRTMDCDWDSPDDYCCLHPSERGNTLLLSSILWGYYVHYFLGLVAAAAPPRSVMNSRRLTAHCFPRFRQKDSTPRYSRNCLLLCAVAHIRPSEDVRGRTALNLVTALHWITS